MTGADPVPVLSVVVPVRARDQVDVEGLCRCLDALDRQHMPREQYEVVVVDDGSVVDLGPAVTGRRGVVLHWIAAVGSYAARNHGLRLARGRLLAFTDADCMPEPDWLLRAVAWLEGEPGLAAVAGAIEVPVAAGSGALALHDALTAFPQHRFVERFGFGATANLVVRRAVLDAVGPFEARLQSGGDAEWGARATAAGHRIGYAADVRVRHPPRSTLRAVVTKALRTTRGVEELAAIRGDTEPLPRAILERLRQPWRELPALLRDPRIPGRRRRAQVFAVALGHATLVAAETLRSRLALLLRTPGELRPLAAGVVLVAAADVLRAARAPASPGSFGDGAAYRRMARGEPAAPPFQRRVLMPWLVRMLTGGGLRDFRAVSLAGVAAGTVGTGWLAARVARECGAPPSRARHAALLAGGLVPVMPHSTRMAVQMPPFNDQIAVALGSLWLVLAGSRGRFSRALAPLAALLAGLTREQWVLVSTAVVAGLRTARGERLAHLAAAAAALAVVLAQPRGPGGEVYPPGVAARRFRSTTGLAELAWGLGSALGTLPVLLPAARRRAARLQHRRATLPALLRVAAVQTGLALVGGSDTPRLLHGGLPFLAAATVGVAAADADRRLAPILAGTLALWRPGVRPEPSETGYERFHLPYMHGQLGIRAFAGVVRVLAATAAARRWCVPEQGLSPGS